WNVLAGDVAKTEDAVFRQREPGVCGDPLDPGLDVFVTFFGCGFRVAVLGDQTLERRQVAARYVTLDILEVEFVQFHQDDILMLAEIVCELRRVTITTVRALNIWEFYYRLF